MRKVATRVQIIQIGKLLDEHYDQEIGFYKDGISDEWIASAVGVNTPSVAKLRRDLFGNFKHTPTSDDRLTAIEARLSALETKVKDLL